MSKVRHVLGISGGKDSAALAIYLKDNYPQINIEYYFCDTDKELDETYILIEKLESYLGKKIIRLKAVEETPEEQFDHFLKLYGGYLPSANARWCTKKLKLEPFENFVGEDPTISYVGIRGDEYREGYISTKTNIQSIFPFRKNIWSQEIIRNALSNANIDILSDICNKYIEKNISKTLLDMIIEPVSLQYDQQRKLNDLLSISTSAFNKIIFEYLKSNDYPISYLDNYPLLDNEDVLVRDDIFKILIYSGVGVPEYYNKREFELDGRKGYYARSRSGCYFCFFQQKIEWVWLYENHRDLFEKAMTYEKDGYTWLQDERLKDLIKPERIRKIKQEQIKKTCKEPKPQSEYLIDILSDAEGEGCAACFV